VENLLIGLAGGLVIAAVFALARRLGRRGRSAGRTAPEISFESFITSMRAVGDLSVFRVMTKEVITASDHWLGEFGKKYLNWLLSEQKITLVIEFDVDFRYDLTDPAFRVERQGDARFKIVLPPCHHEVLIRNLRIHSEDKSELLPWLMPDLLGRFFTGGFSVEAKNKLIAETRLEASRLAGDLVRKAADEAEASARRTLTMLAQGLGAWDVAFEFRSEREFKPRVDTTPLEEATRRAADAQKRLLGRVTEESAE
jgi:hypothetical protein